MIGNQLLLALCSVTLLVTAGKVKRDNCPVADVSIIAHEGDTVGREEFYKDVDLYITGDETASKAIVYLTDVYGIQLAQNKLLADSFGRAGYLVVAPDLFNGTPAPNDIDGSAPGFNTTAFLEQHGPEVTDPLIETALDYLHTVKNVSRIGTTGYCFGGRFAFRQLAPNTGVDVGFAAHPSNLQNEEIEAITGPFSVAAADGDSMMPPARRSEIEALLLNTTQAYTLSLYGSVGHGFGVRANVTDPRQKFGKEQAFFQAVRWFETWL